MQHANEIDSNLAQLDTNISNNPEYVRLIELELAKAVRSTYSAAIADATGYCMVLKIPEASIRDILRKVSIDDSNVSAAFVKVWDAPSHAHMINNPYYHTLLFFLTYGIRHNNYAIQKDATTLLLVKLWNGRRIHFIPVCKADVMRYVVANATGKYLIRKYDGPLNLITEYFTPSLLKTYGERINKNSAETKRFFDQAWGRLEQLFIQNMRVDLTTGEKKATAGIAYLYYTAEKAGLKIMKPRGSSSNMDDMADAEHYSSNEYDDVISNLVNFMVMNINPTYEPSFLDFLIKNSTVNRSAAEMILTGMHSNRYADYIRDILELMFKQLQVHNKSEICSKDFLNETIKKKFIASKHTPIITQLKAIINDFLEHIFQDMSKKLNRPLSYSGYSVPRQGHIRKVIFYGFAYNIQKFMCSSAGGGQHGYGS